MAEAYFDAEPGEAVTVTGVGPMTLRRAVHKHDCWHNHQGLPLVVVYRSADKVPTTFDMADLDRMAGMVRFL